MSYGLEIINSNDRIIIDEKYANYQVYSQGIIQTNSYNPYLNGPNYAYVPVPSNVNWLLLIAPTFFSYTHEYLVVGNGISVFNWPNGLEVSVAVKYIVLVQVDTMPVINSGYGLSVFNQNGKFTFSTAYRSANFHTSVYFVYGVTAWEYYLSNNDHLNYVCTTDFGVKNEYTYYPGQYESEPEVYVQELLTIYFYSNTYGGFGSYSISQSSGSWNTYVLGEIFSNSYIPFASFA